MKNRILVVDDEAGFTHLLKLVLPAYDIREENDATRAVAAAREFKPDLILLDIIMPRTDGAAVAAELRKDPALSTIPVVFLTAIVSSTEAEARKTIDGYPCLSKPVTKAALLKCINEHLPV